MGKTREEDDDDSGSGSDGSETPGGVADEEHGINDEAVAKEEKKIKKRRRDNNEDEDNGSNDEEEGQDLDDTADDDDNEKETTTAKISSSKKKKQKKVHRLSLKKTEDFNEKLRKRGVIYIARIPPRMTPTKLKSLLGDFGTEVTRIYLVEEDPTVRKRRKQNSTNGKSGGKRYNEGWVEFESKKFAKHIAMSLNNTQISNHKRNPHYGM